MNRQEMIRSMNKKTQNSDLISVPEFMVWGNCSERTARRKLKGLQHVPGTKKYYIPEVVDNLYLLENGGY